MIKQEDISRIEIFRYVRKDTGRTAYFVRKWNNGSIELDEDADFESIDNALNKLLSDLHDETDEDLYGCDAATREVMFKTHYFDEYGRQWIPFTEKALQQPRKILLDLKVNSPDFERRRMETEFARAMDDYGIPRQE